MLLIDKYAYTNKLRKINPMVKFSFAMGILIFSLLPIPLWLYGGVSLIMGYLTVKSAGIPIKNYWKMLMIPLTFLVLSVISLIVSFGESGEVFMWAIKVKSMYVGITPQGIDMSIRLFLRSTACITCMYFYSLTTPLDQQIQVYKKLRIPNEVIELMVLIYRFIFIFLEEAKEIRNAQEMRFGYNTFKQSCHSFSLLIKVLFIRVMQRNKDMQISLESKFFNGEFHI